MKQILTHDVRQYGFYGFSATILTLTLPRSILLHQIHKTPYCPYHRSIFVDNISHELKVFKEEKLAIDVRPVFITYLYIERLRFTETDQYFVNTKG